MKEPPNWFEPLRFGVLGCCYEKVSISVARLGNLLDFGQLFKAFGNINLPKSPTFLGNFCKCVKSIIFPVKSFLGNFNRHLATSSGHTGLDKVQKQKNDVSKFFPRVINVGREKQKQKWIKSI